MRRLLLLFVLLAMRLNAQSSTTVTGTVGDKDSVAWLNGTYTFTFVGPPIVSWPGGTVPRTITGNLDATGSFSRSVPNNNTITPSPSSWTLTVCPSPQVSAPASSCFIKTNCFITGVSQTINIQPPGLRIPPGPQNVAYSTVEVTPAPYGSQITIFGTPPSVMSCTAATGNVCNTWSPVSGASSWTAITGKPGQCAPGLLVINVATGACGPPFPPTLTQLFSFPCAGTANPVPNPPWQNYNGASGGIGGDPFQSISGECQQVRFVEGSAAYAVSWSLPNDQYAQAQLDAFNVADNDTANPLVWSIGIRGFTNSSPNAGNGYYIFLTANPDNATIDVSIFFGPTTGTQIDLIPTYTFHAGDTFGMAVVGSEIFALHNGQVIGATSDPSFTSGVANIISESFGLSGIPNDVQWSNISAGAAAIGEAAPVGGFFTIAAGATTAVVSSGSVTPNSKIFVQEDSTLGTALGVTCNTSPPTNIFEVTARSTATSFTVTANSAAVTNPYCLSYLIIN